MKKLLRGFFRALGLEVRRIQPPPPPRKPAIRPDSMRAGLERVKKNGVNPSALIDLGAAQGLWSLEAVNVWPQAKFVLFEPLEERREELQALTKTYPNFLPVHAAAGSEKGVTRFQVSDDLDGSGVYDSGADGGNREVQVTTIDDEIARLQLRPPYLLKFDTHGYELPILDGAKETLKQTDLIVMECYGFRIAQSSLLFSEMCAHMEQLGFRLADVVDIMRRPGDDLFWQCDAFFLRSSHPSFRRNTYAE